MVIYLFAAVRGVAKDDIKGRNIVLSFQFLRTYLIYVPCNSNSCWQPGTSVPYSTPTPKQRSKPLKDML